MINFSKREKMNEEEVVNKEKKNENMQHSRLWRFKSINRIVFIISNIENNILGNRHIIEVFAQLYQVWICHFSAHFPHFLFSNGHWHFFICCYVCDFTHCPHSWFFEKQSLTLKAPCLKRKSFSNNYICPYTFHPVHTKCSIISGVYFASNTPY